MLSATKLSKSIGSTDILKNIDVALKANEAVALTGPSGSGKTSLLHILGLLDHPTTGTVKILNTDTKDLTEKERTILRRDSMGFVYQFHHLLPNFDALENVAMPLLIQGKNKQKAFAESAALLKEVGLQHRLHPFTSFAVIPLFALANAGVRIDAGVFGDPGPRAVAVGVVIGLVVGKVVGITVFTWLAVRLGLGQLPDNMSWTHLVGVAAVAGIGFTVSLFIADLAFGDAPVLESAAKLGVLAASLLAAALGSGFLWRSSRVPAPPHD